MATMASGLNAAQGPGAATAKGSHASWASSASFAAAWLDAAVAWQSAVCVANLEAARSTQRAWRPEAWAQLGEQWAYMLHNGPIPS